MPAHHYHPRELWNQRVALKWLINGEGLAVFRDLQDTVNITPPLWEILVNSILVPSPTLASCCPPKSRSCTMKCTYLQGPYNTHAHLIPNHHAPLTLPGQPGLPGTSQLLSVCLRLSQSLYMSPYLFLCFCCCLLSTSSLR